MAKTPAPSSPADPAAPIPTESGRVRRPYLGADTPAAPVPQPAPATTPAKE